MPPCCERAELPEDFKVAGTIADLDAADHIRAAHVAEAIQYRSLDRDVH